MIPKRFIDKLLQFDRGKCEISRYINGYLLDSSDDWSLIQAVDRDIYFNGYSVLANKTIKRYRILNDGNHMVHRALRKLGYIPKKPKGIQLNDIHSIVMSVNRIFSLLIISRELWKNDVCQIGSIAQITKKTITLATIDTEAEHDGFFRICSKDITAIEFGSHYDKALWAAASKKTKNCLTNAFQRLTKSIG